MDTLWEAYPAQREAHAYGVLCELANVDQLDETLWQQYQQRYADIQAYIEEQKKVSRHKDEVNPFRNMTYWDDDERAAVLS
jgi:succinylglutamate desuccinylase